jgi:hypothetical protein
MLKLFEKAGLQTGFFPYFTSFRKIAHLKLAHEFRKGKFSSHKAGKIPAAT